MCSLRKGVLAILITQGMMGCGVQESLFDNDSIRNLSNETSNASQNQNNLNPPNQDQGPGINLPPSIGAVSFESTSSNNSAGSEITCSAPVSDSDIDSIFVEFQLENAQGDLLAILARTQIQAGQEASYIVSIFEEGQLIRCRVIATDQAGHSEESSSNAYAVASSAHDFVSLTPVPGSAVLSGSTITCGLNESALMNAGTSFDSETMSLSFDFISIVNNVETPLATAVTPSGSSTSVQYQTSASLNTFVSCRMHLTKMYSERDLTYTQTKGSVRVAQGGGGGCRVGPIQTPYVNVTAEYRYRYPTPATKICAVQELDLALDL